MVTGEAILRAAAAVDTPHKDLMAKFYTEKVATMESAHGMHAIIPFCRTKVVKQGRAKGCVLLGGEGREDGLRAGRQTGRDAHGPWGTRPTTLPGVT